MTSHEPIAAHLPPNGSTFCRLTHSGYPAADVYLPVWICPTYLSIVYPCCHLFFTDPTDPCSQFGGIVHQNGQSCCAASCGALCGAAQCNLGGSENCCGSTIESTTNFCSASQSAPCRIPGIASCLMPHTKLKRRICIKFKVAQRVTTTVPSKLSINSELDMEEPYASCETRALSRSGPCIVLVPP